MLYAEVLLGFISRIAPIGLARKDAHGRGNTDEDGLRDGLHLERGEHGVCFEPSSMEGRARPDHMLDCVLRITAQVALHVCNVARLADAFFGPSNCFLDDAYEVSFFFFKFSVNLRGRDIIDFVEVNYLPSGSFSGRGSGQCGDALQHRLQLLDWTFEDVEVGGLCADYFEVDGEHRLLFVELGQENADGAERPEVRFPFVLAWVTW